MKVDLISKMHCIVSFTLKMRNGELTWLETGISVFLENIALKNYFREDYPLGRGGGGGGGGGGEEIADPVTKLHLII